MGKSAILLVLVSMYAWSMSFSTRSKVALSRVDEQALYEEKVLARERAMTGFEIVVSGTENDFKNFRTNLTSQSYQDGGFTYSAVGMPDNTVQVTATGKVGRSEYTFVGELVNEGGAKLGALNFDGPISSAAARGASYLITGVNTTPPGNAIAAAKSKGANAMGVFSKLKKTEKEVTGGLRPELVTGGDDGAPGSFAFGDAGGDDMADFDALAGLINGLCDGGDDDYSNCRVLSGDQIFAGNEVFGSPGNPTLMIVKGNATLRGKVHGYGILFVEGDFKTEVGEPVWEGLVMASSTGGFHELRGQPSIYGATILRTTDPDGVSAVEDENDAAIDPLGFLVRGEPKFYYSSAALGMLSDNISPAFGPILVSGSGKITLKNVRQASSDAAGSFATLREMAPVETVSQF